MSTEPEASEALPENFQPVGGGFYIVRTQAGFRKAIRYALGVEWVDGVRDYPQAYPALVSLSLGYRGYFYVQVHSIHLNTLKDAIKDQ